MDLKKSLLLVIAKIVKKKINKKSYSDFSSFKFISYIFVIEKNKIY